MASNTTNNSIELNIIDPPAYSSQPNIPEAIASERAQNQIVDIDVVNHEQTCQGHNLRPPSYPGIKTVTIQEANQDFEEAENLQSRINFRNAQDRMSRERSSNGGRSNQNNHNNSENDQHSGSVWLAKTVFPYIIFNIMVLSLARIMVHNCNKDLHDKYHVDKVPHTFGHTAIDFRNRVYDESTDSYKILATDDPEMKNLIVSPTVLKDFYKAEEQKCHQRQLASRFFLITYSRIMVMSIIILSMITACYNKDYADIRYSVLSFAMFGIFLYSVNSLYIEHNFS